MSQIVRASGFSKTTAFRVVASLRDVRFVFQAADNRRYGPGHRHARISHVAARPDVAAHSLKLLAGLSRDTVFYRCLRGLRRRLVAEIAIGAGAAGMNRQRIQDVLARP